MRVEVLHLARARRYGSSTGEPMRERDAARAERTGAELAAIIDAMADGLVVYGPTGEVRSMNEAAFRYVVGEPPGGGATVAPSRGPCFVDAEGTPLAPERNPVARALAGELVRGLHLQTADPESGRRGWISASAAPIRGPGGRIDGAVLSFSDETGVYRLQEERDDLLRAVTHDLRTPLNAIYMQALLMARTAGADGAAAERGRHVVKSCERMSEMLQDLADSALLEAGRLPFSPVPVALPEFMAELLARLQGGIEVGRVRLSLQPGLPRVKVDPARLERILVNLLSNALKYSPEESEVDVRAIATEGEVRISVADRGVGITAEDQAHLFDRWFRARGARRPDGLGLGLYIARLLVEAQGGRIQLESAPGQGSTFHLCLPALPDGADGSVPVGFIP
jgi:signal transduction histidine kinase